MSSRSIDGIIHVTSTKNIHGVTSNIVGVNDTQTLTNKTLTSPIISTIVNTGTLTLPTITGTIVSNNNTIAFSNKTIDAVVNTLSNITNTNISSTAGITATKIGNGDVSNTSLSYINNLNQAVASTSSPTFVNLNVSSVASQTYYLAQLSTTTFVTSTWLDMSFTSVSNGNTVTFNATNKDFTFTKSGVYVCEVKFNVDSPFGYSGGFEFQLLYGTATGSASTLWTIQATQYISPTDSSTEFFTRIPFVVDASHLTFRPQLRQNLGVTLTLNNSGWSYILISKVV